MDDQTAHDVLAASGAQVHFVVHFVLALSQGSIALSIITGWHGMFAQSIHCGRDC